MPELERIELASQEHLMTVFRRFQPEICELSFGNLFTWRKSEPVYFVDLNDALVFVVVLQGEAGGYYGLGAPLGAAPSPARLRELIPGLQGFIRVTDAYARVLTDEGLQVVEDRANDDYVYRVSDLADLPGEKYHKKRNLIHQCLDSYACCYEPMTAGIVGECLAMQAEWCRMRQCDRTPSLCREFDAIAEAFGNYDKLGLIGGVIRIEGRIVAYAVAEWLNPATAAWHFEKALPGFKGLAQLMNQWFAAHALQGFEFANREQDMDLPGLRQAKESYFPHHKVKKYRAVFDQPDILVKPSDYGIYECDRRALLIDQS